MIRKCTDEDISDEELEKVINPFYDNYHEYIITYVMPEVIAFYIASSYSRNAMWEATFYQHYNSAKDIFNVSDDEDYDKVKAEKVMFIITTDGYENASRKFTKEQIKEMIQGHKEWEFMYIGADIDSYSEGQSIGINSSNISNYKKDGKGISKMFKAMFKASDAFCDEDCIDSSWKEELEEYMEENEKKEILISSSKCS